MTSEQGKEQWITRYLQYNVDLYQSEQKKQLTFLITAPLPL